MPGIIYQSILSQLKEHSCRQSRLMDDMPVAIYGAGNVGKDVFDLLTRRGFSVLCFFDQNAHSGDTWRGVPILPPDKISLAPQERKNTQVVVAIFNAYAEIPPILTMLKNQGFDSIFTFLEVFEQFGDELGQRFWLAPKSFYAEQESSINAAYDLWADEQSRSLYVAILKFRTTGDYSILPIPDRHHQYFPLDIPPWRTPLRFVDCGAFEGDTLRYLITSGLEVEAIAAFEPDPANFAKLTQFVEDNRTQLPELVKLFPFGVLSSTKQVRFSSGQGTGSHSLVAGDAFVQCVTLDEKLVGFKPTLIKMDIEGAELEALWGARHVIEEYRPELAICVYHRPEHL